jgi:hypothetical protein
MNAMKEEWSTLQYQRNLTDAVALHEFSQIDTQKGQNPQGPKQ